MQSVALSLADVVFMIFVLITLFCLATRRDAILPTSIGLVAVGTILKKSLIGGLMVAFNAILSSTTDLINIIAVIALIVMLTKIMEEMGADRLMVAPLRGLLGNPYLSYWVIGLAMLLLSWFIWPTPAAPLLGALVVPLAIASGLPPMIAAMAMSIFGKGVGLSSDFVIQGMPAVTAKMTKQPIEQIISTSIPAWLAVSLVAIGVSFLIAIRSIRRSRASEPVSTEAYAAVAGVPAMAVAAAAEGPANSVAQPAFAAAATAPMPVQSAGSQRLPVIGDYANSTDTRALRTAANDKLPVSMVARIMAWVIPICLFADIYFMGALKLRGANATALIGGTVLFLTMICCVFQFKGNAFTKAMDYARHGWMFAVKVFGPVVIIAGFFWLGGESLKSIVGNNQLQGLMFDWGYWIAYHVPINKLTVSIVVTIASVLGAFDGLGIAAIPLGASIAVALGKPIGANVSVLAVQAQMAAIWTGATLVPWGFLAVTAAITGVDPKELARRNLWPTLLGLAAAVVITALMA